MNTKIIYALIIIFTIGVVSCNKEEITVEEPEIIIDPPQELEYPVAVGIVKDENGELGDAIISVFQKGELKGKTTSTTNGEFSTINIETVKDEDLILVFEKDEYNTEYRKRSNTTLESSSLEVQLLTKEAVYGESSSLSGLDASEYISLSGYIKDLQGMPNRARIAVDYMIDDTNFGAMTTTDNNGYYELLLAKGVDLNVSIFSDTICFDYLTEEEVSIFGGLEAEVMGPFSQDVVLDDYINPYVSARDFQVGGQLFQCNGDPSSYASIQIGINDNQGRDYYYVYETGPGDMFSISENDCVTLPYTVSIIGIDLENYLNSDTLFIEVTEQIYINNNIQLTACNSIETGYSTAVMNVDGVEYIYNQVETRKEGNDLIAEGVTLSFAEFTIPNVQLGANTIESLQLLNWISGEAFIAVNDVMPAQVTSLTSNSAEVIVTGEFRNSLDEIITGTCTLNLKF